MSDERGLEGVEGPGSEGALQNFVEKKGRDLDPQDPHSCAPGHAKAKSVTDFGF